MTSRPVTSSNEAPAYGPELEGFSYPWPVQNFEFVCQGTPVHMAYMDVKPATPNGHVVILLHGKNYVAATWKATIAALLSDMIYSQPVLYEFGDLRMPVLLVIGDKDTTAFGKDVVPPAVRATLGNYPKLGKEAASRIPHVRLVEFPDLGHSPQIQAPEVFHKVLLDWLMEFNSKFKRGG